MLALRRRLKAHSRAIAAGLFERAGTDAAAAEVSMYGAWLDDISLPPAAAESDNTAGTYTRSR